MEIKEFLTSLCYALYVASIIGRNSFCFNSNHKFMLWSTLFRNQLKSLNFHRQMLSGGSEQRIPSLILPESPESLFSGFGGLDTGSSSSRQDRYAMACKQQQRNALLIKRKTVIMLIVIVVEFFICQTPNIVLQTWVAFDRVRAWSSITTKQASIIVLLTYVSTCCNPITYCFMSQRFREAFAEAFLGRSRTRQQEYIASHGSYSVITFRRSHQRDLLDENGRKRDSIASNRLNASNFNGVNPPQLGDSSRCAWARRWMDLEITSFWHFEREKSMCITEEHDVKIYDSWNETFTLVSRMTEAQQDKESVSKFFFSLYVWSSFRFLSNSMLRVIWTKNEIWSTWNVSLASCFGYNVASLDWKLRLVGFWFWKLAKT